MAVQSVSRIRTGQRSQLEYANKRATIVYQVLTDPGDPQDVALNAAGLPVFNAAHPEDATLRARNRTASGEAPRFEVEVEYAPVGIFYAAGQAPQYSTDPLTNPPTLTWSTRKTTEEVDFCYQQRTMQGGVTSGALGIALDPPSVPIRNTAGQRFAQNIVAERSDIVLTIGVNRASLNATLHYQFRDAINLDSFLGEQPGTWKVEGIAAVLQNAPPVPVYWRIEYTLVFRADGWDARIANIGTMARKIVGGKASPIMRDGQQVTEEVPLDINGLEAAEGADQIWILGRIYPLKNYADLGLGV